MRQPLVWLDINANAIPHSCIHRNKGQRWVSDAEKLQRREEFRREVSLLVPRVQKKNLSGPLLVEVEIWRKTARAADADNLTKEVFDALTDAGVWNDDRQVQAYSVRVHQGPAEKPRIMVKIWSDEDRTSRDGEASHTVRPASPKQPTNRNDPNRPEKLPAKARP